MQNPQVANFFFFTHQTGSVCVPRPYHFRLPGFCHLVTALYPSSTDDVQTVDEVQLSKLGFCKNYYKGVGGWVCKWMNEWVSKWMKYSFIFVSFVAETQRVELHKRLLLPEDRPLMRTVNSYSFDGETKQGTGCGIFISIMNLLYWAQYHVIGVCLPSQSSPKKHKSRKKKAHKPFHTSWISQTKVSAMLDHHLKSCYFNCVE